MFGLSVATGLLQGSTERTWHCVLNFANLLWRKINHIKQTTMPKSRKRHHSRSRSRSRSPSRDRDEKYKKYDSYEKDRDGKRRKVDSFDSPPHKRSISCERQLEEHENSVTVTDNLRSKPDEDVNEDADGNVVSLSGHTETSNEGGCSSALVDNFKVTNTNDDSEPSKEGSTRFRSKDKLDVTPKRVLSPKQLKKREEWEKKRLEKQREKEERERVKNEEKMKKKRELEQKQKEKQMKLEQKKKEREEKEELKRKEKEEKEKMRKEKEEREEQKRKEREQEKLKKQQEMEEKNREKQKEEEKKQKAAAAFVNFFVPTKKDDQQRDDDGQAFKTFEVKSDMKLPSPRRNQLTDEEILTLDKYLETQDDSASYLKDLKSGKVIGKSNKTWPVEDLGDDDVTFIETDPGKTIDEDIKQIFRAKFLKFKENRRPAYFGTWRKKSKHVKPRRPFAEDKEIFNYEEDSDDDWEEEEQGESLNGSDDEADKENDDEKDDYEIDNDFFVPHGHLSDDEIDDEEQKRLEPELQKQKLKLLKDEFEQDMQSKTHKLKPRYIGCVWYNKDGSNVDETIDKYLKPLAMMTDGEIVVKGRHVITVGRKGKSFKEMDPKYIPIFVKVVQGNTSNKKTVIEEFLTEMANNEYSIDMTKVDLFRNLKSMATWRKSSKGKCCWMVNEEVAAKYGIDQSN